MLAEQYDLGAVILAAEKPRLLRLTQRPPIIDAAVRPPLRLKPPAPVGVALETHQRTFAAVPRPVLEPMRIPRARGHLRSDAKVSTS